ncbi:hypothetical protein [Streptomyces atratus]|uniref:hypothetical protein n=1 Tax=Streptomyces atratus TaxID=1893 RepID=UPI003867352D
MRVVIVTESFPPDVNGVAHCTLQTARHLVGRGHEPLVVAAERGHRTAAAGFHALPAARGPATGAAPGLEPRRPPPSRLDSWLRLATAGTGRLARRSTDLLPRLLCLAGAELRHRACGTVAHLDGRAEEALRSALTAAEPTGVQGAGPSGPSSVPRVSMEG